MVTIWTSVFDVTIPNFQASESLNDGRRRLPPPPATRRRLQQQFPLLHHYGRSHGQIQREIGIDRHRSDTRPWAWKQNRFQCHTWRPTWAPSQGNGFRRSVRSEKKRTTMPPLQPYGEDCTGKSGSCADDQVRIKRLTSNLRRAPASFIKRTVPKIGRSAQPRSCTPPIDQAIPV